MNTLLRLYPPAWRRRYGDEIVQVLSGTPLSAAVVFDLLRGILDAWLYPSLTQNHPIKGSWIRQALLVTAIAISISHPELARARSRRNLRIGPAIGA